MDIPFLIDLNAAIQVGKRFCVEYFPQLLCDANGKRTLRRNLTSICSFISVVLPRRSLIVFEYIYI